ncbi:MFS transporter [Actinosynnema sp. NPDC020468]|uniref:MFS transporter n=1 Tax=Actinosynnema sp. NPDC020468 TaxID=3154488 RepID=UPI0033C72704
MLEALHVKDFRLLWGARSISQLGSWLLVVAVPAQVLALTHSLLATGYALAAEFLPPVLLGPIAGVLVDRWDRRRVMIAADLLRAVAVLALLPVREPRHLWLVYVALVVESVGTLAFRPAAQAHVPAVVGTGRLLGSANALNSLTDGAVRLIGGPLGGVLFATAGFHTVVWLDAATYLISVLALTRTTRRPRTDLTDPATTDPNPDPDPATPTAPGTADPVATPGRSAPAAATPPASSAPVPTTATTTGTAADSTAATTAPVGTPVGVRGVFADLVAGWGFLRRSATLSALLVVTTLFLGANASLTALLMPFAVESLGGATQGGVLMSGLGVGFLLGAPVVRWAVDRVEVRALLGVALVLTGLGFALLFGSASMLAAVPSAVLIGMAGSTVVVGTQTAVQRATPDAVLGRVSAALFTGEAAATLVGALAGPALAEATSIRVVALAACGSTLVGALSAALLIPAPRRAT